jgi:excisionase family DNA binding protein
MHDDVVDRGRMPEYLTTKELADLLRIKERKVYDLASTGAVPCSRAMGKLLFPRKAIEDWLARSGSGLDRPVSAPLPAIFLGSHDPLLDWALRESRCGLATFFDGSVDGLRRFAQDEGLATGLHLYDAANDGWNREAAIAYCGLRPVVLIEWAVRQRGLIVGKEIAGTIRSLADVKGRRIATRQAEAGAQQTFLALLARAGLTADDIDQTPLVRTEADAALSVLEGKADAAFGLQALAGQYRLPFVPVIGERYDLLVDRRSWFDEPMQVLLAFCNGAAFRARAAELAGYSVAGFGKVHFNGP